MRVAIAEQPPGLQGDRVDTAVNAAEQRRVMSRGGEDKLARRRLGDPKAKAKKAKQQAAPTEAEPAPADEAAADESSAKESGDE